MWDQANVAKSNKGRLRAIGQKSLKICIFMFDINKFEDQESDCFTIYELLNLSDLNQVELDELGINYVHCDDENFARIAIIK